MNKSWLEKINNSLNMTRYSSGIHKYLSISLIIQLAQHNDPNHMSLWNLVETVNRHLDE